MHRGYPGFEGSFLGVWIWADLCRELGIILQDVTLVDRRGHNIVHVGLDGFNAAHNNALNADANFELPKSNDLVVYSGHEYDDVVKDAGYLVSRVDAIGNEVCRAGLSSWSRGLSDQPDPGDVSACASAGGAICGSCGS